MRIDILTLFPEAVAAMSHSILARAEKAGAIEIKAHNIRDYTLDKHGKCDDYPFGGGDGMLMTPQPIHDAVAAVDPTHGARRIYMSPKGKLLDAKAAARLAKERHIVILCGHYEGVDQRVLDADIDEEISIGDYILTGGELPAMVLCDCVARHVEGVLGNPDSAEIESFSGNLLEYPQYTRPAVWEGVSVPDVLLSGNHAAVDKWRLERQEELTAELRPDLYKKYSRAKLAREKRAAAQKAAEKAARKGR